MGMTMRVSLPGYDCLTDTTIDNYSIYADTDNILIKEKTRGTISVANIANGTIAHSLGYIPLYFTYCQVSSGRYRLSTYRDLLGDTWRTYVDTSNLYIQNRQGTAGTAVRYYIFHDELT